MSWIRYFREAFSGAHTFSTYSALPSTCLRPGLNFKNDAPPPNDVVMLASATLALLCLGDEHYLRTGRWCLSTDERIMLLKKIDTTCEVSLEPPHKEESLNEEGNPWGSSTRSGYASRDHGDGCLSAADFEAFCSEEKNQQWVLEAFPSSAHGLACLSLMKSAVLHFDKNSDKMLDESEWHLFLDFCAQLRLRYLQQMALVHFRAYFGRGQSDADPIEGNMDTNCHVRNVADAIKEVTMKELEQGSRMKSRIQMGVLVEDWKGWWADLYYYSSNVHPLHGIWACCATNRLDRDERLMMEIAVLCFCYWMSHEGEDADHLPEWLQNRILRDTLFITIPSQILYWLLFALCTTPNCGTVDESSADPSTIKRAKAVSKSGDIFANVLVVCLLVSAIIRVFFDRKEASADHAALVFRTLKSRVLAYFFCWCQIVGIYFNPFFAWGSPEPNTTCLGDWIGLGQWSMERSKVALTTLILPEGNQTVQITKSRTTIDSVALQIAADEPNEPDPPAGPDEFCLPSTKFWPKPVP